MQYSVVTADQGCSTEMVKTSTKEVNVDTLINNELAKKSEWLKINKLSFNVNK